MKDYRLNTEIAEYILEFENLKTNEIDEFLKEIIFSYHEIVKQSEGAKNQYYLAMVSYIIIKMLNVTEISLIGLTVKNITLFSCLFLVICSYLFFRCIEIWLHKGHLFLLYSELSGASKRKYFKYKFHYYLIPNTIGLIEEIHEKKFGVKNKQLKMFEIPIFIVTFGFVFFLLAMTVMDSDAINFSSEKLIAFFILLSVIVSIALLVTSVVNLYNFTKIIKTKR